MCPPHSDQTPSFVDGTLCCLECSPGVVWCGVVWCVCVCVCCEHVQCGRVCNVEECAMWRCVQ